jgi:hypothetical protein
MAILTADGNRCPRATAVKLAISVAGGQTIISTAVRERAPAMIFFSSTIEPCSPFIFQFATPSGWGALAMFSSPGLGQTN